MWVKEQSELSMGTPVQWGCLLSAALAAFGGFARLGPCRVNSMECEIVMVLVWRHHGIRGNTVVAPSAFRFGLLQHLVALTHGLSSRRVPPHGVASIKTKQFATATFHACSAACRLVTSAISTRYSVSRRATCR